MWASPRATRPAAWRSCSGLRRAGEPVVTEAETDVRGWKPGETVRISAEAPEGIGRYEVFLRAVGGQNGEPILFANEGTHADGAVSLGVLTKEKGGLFS